MMKAIMKDDGVTLIELMMSISIFTIVMLGSVKMIVDQRRVYHQADQYLELQGQVRAALDILSAEIRMAGSGINQQFAHPIYYAFNDTTTLGDYPTLSDLKDTTLGQNRSFGVIGFQYDRNVEIRNDGTELRDTITNGDVMLIGMSSSVGSNDPAFKTVTMKTYTDEGTSSCSNVSSTAACVAAYVYGDSPITFYGASTTEVFDLEMHTIDAAGRSSTQNVIMGNVINFDITYYIDSSDTGYTDVATMALGSRGDNHDNDNDGATDEKAEVATITDTTDVNGFCDVAEASGGEVFCSATDGIIALPLATNNKSSVFTVTAPTPATLNPSTDLYYIKATATATFTGVQSIASGTAGDYVTIVNAGTFPIIFTDDDIDATTNVELKSGTVVLSPNQTISFQYSSSSKWIQTTSAVANIAAVKITLTARSEKRDPRTGKYLVYSGTITTKLRGYAL